MKVKKLIAMALMLTTIGAGLVGCGGTKAAENGDVTTINLYSDGSDNVRATWESVIKEFEAQNPDVKVNLQFLSSGTGGQGGADKLIAATKSNQDKIDIDILECSDNSISRLIKEAGEESLTTLSQDNIPNLKSLTTQSSVGKDKSMVFRGTTVVLAYNSEKISNPPTTDKELYQWIKDNPGKFAYNDPTTGGAGGSFLTTAIYNKLPEEALTSDDTKWAEQWDEGFKLLEELHPYMYQASGKVQYPTKNQGTLDLLADGSVDIIPAWADMALDQKSKGLLPESIKLSQISPSLTGGVQSLVIPSLSEKKEASYKFLNFCASSEGQAIFVEEQKAIPVIEKSLLSKETLDMLSGLEVDEFRSYTIGSLSDELGKRWQSDIATLK